MPRRGMLQAESINKTLLFFGDSPFYSFSHCIFFHTRIKLTTNDISLIKQLLLITRLPWSNRTVTQASAGIPGSVSPI